MPRTVMVILSVAPLVLFGAAIAPSASAAPVSCGSSFTASGKIINAYGCFQALGDKIIAHDGASDGHHVEVYWSVGRYSGVCKDYDGDDFRDGYDHGGHTCDYDFAEHSTVCLRAAVVEGDRIVGEYTERACFPTT